MSSWSQTIQSCIPSLVAKLVTPTRDKQKDWHGTTAVASRALAQARILTGGRKTSGPVSIFRPDQRFWSATPNGLARPGPLQERSALDVHFFGTIIHLFTGKRCGSLGSITSDYRPITMWCIMVKTDTQGFFSVVFSPFLRNFVWKFSQFGVFA